MSVYNDWQKNHEQRRILQAAIYDVVLAEPHKPYYDISNEFDISVQSAKNLLKEYCEALNIENPKRKGFSEKEKDPTEIAKNSRNKKRAFKEISDEMIINGKKCVIKKEYDKTLIVIFEGEYEPVMVVKKTHEEIRKRIIMITIIQNEVENMPLIKSKVLKRRINGEITVIEREQLEEEILERFDDENIEESQMQRILADELNVVDRGFLLQVKNVFYCALDLDLGEMYQPPSAGVIAEAWNKGIINSSQIDVRLKDYKKAFKKKKKSS